MALRRPRVRIPLGPQKNTQGFDKFALSVCLKIEFCLHAGIVCHPAESRRLSASRRSEVDRFRQNSPVDELQSRVRPLARIGAVWLYQPDKQGGTAEISFVPDWMKDFFIFSQKFLLDHGVMQ